jgi:endonuclease YncB( thermonuclease family)
VISKEEEPMRTKCVTAAFLCLLTSAAGWSPAQAGDSLYGKVTEVKSGDVVTFDSGGEKYDLRLVGIETAKDDRLTDGAVKLTSSLVLGKNARMRFEGLDKDGLLRARLFTDDPVLGIKEVAQELVRAGLVRRQAGFDFKYGELAAAESEARSAHRGLWATQQP